MMHGIWFWHAQVSPCMSSWRTVFSSHLTESCALVKHDQADLADDSQSVGKSTFPCQKTKCACMLGVGSTFSKCQYSACWKKGKSDLSPWRVQKKLLKCLNANFIINVDCFCALSLAAAWACGNSALNFITYCFPVELQFFVLYDNAISDW